MLSCLPQAHMCWTVYRRLVQIDERITFGILVAVELQLMQTQGSSVWQHVQQQADVWPFSQGEQCFQSHHLFYSEPAASTHDEPE